MVTRVDRATAERVVLELAFRLGREPHRERVQVVAEDLSSFDAPAWTVAELDRAARFIAMDPALAKEVSYSRTITTAVFGMARERFVVRCGRPFTHPEAVEALAGRGIGWDQAFTVARHGEATVFLLDARAALAFDKHPLQAA